MQNYKNHHRYVPLYHFVTPTVLLCVIIGCTVNLIHSSCDNRYSASLLLVISLLMALVWYYEREFALKAQDRAIRAEENLRYFSMMGSLLPSSLTMSQIIALRFAGDDEFEALVKKAANENLDADTIKKSIQNWRGDFDRA